MRAGRRPPGQEPARPPEADPADSRWLAACFERGAVTACFVATPEFRIIRLHTRYRRDLIQERTRDKQRAEKLLESAAIKISSVVSDLHGVTGRDIMDHLIAGERNPRVLAQLARTAARRKMGQLEEALEGAEFFTAEHAGLLTAMLERIDRVTADIARLSEVIEQLLAPYEEQLQQAESMPGWRRRSAEDAIAESGSPGASPRQGPLRTVRARHPGTRLKQAPRALRARVLASCVCGPGARGRRRCVSGGFGSRPACHARPGRRGSRRRSPCEPR